MGNTSDDEMNTTSSESIHQQKIPRKKRARTNDNESDIHEKSDSNDDDDNNDDEVDVSLNDLKRRVLGRDLKTDDDSDADEDKEIRQIRQLMNTSGPENDNNHDPSTPSADNALAEKLRKEMMCTICHEVAYPPISLLCGHSFCQPCVEWWFGYEMNCPTCRQSVPDARKVPRAPNLALRACTMAMFGNEIIERLQSRKPRGENGGAHSSGYQVLSELDDETWHYIEMSRTTVGGTNNGVVQARRSIVLDGDDQRMQLALAIDKYPEKIMENQLSGFRVKLCLLTMEEDEVEDSGFPINIVNSEDEHLICSKESRFLNSWMEVQMKNENGVISPLARISSDINGYFDYTLDPSDSAGNPTEARAFLFEHSDTGCLLELDIAQLQKGFTGSTLRPQQQPTSSPLKRRSDGYVMGEGDSSDMEEAEDSFEDDGFLVGEGDSEVEGEFSDEDDDHCTICKEGGELMICDGGKENDGCGKSFHAACVNRQVIPEGDWICQNCAQSGGINAGPEGHEFPVRKRDIFATSSNNISPTDRLGHRRILDESDNDDEKLPADNEASKEEAKSNSISKRRRVLDDSDSD